MKSRLIVADLETTGLDPKNDLVLELGITVTDENLNILHQNSWLVREEGWEQKIRNADSFVKDMHVKSGLFDELISEDPKEQSSEEALVSLMAWKWLTDELGLEPGVYPMTGNSVHFDRAFAKEHLLVFEAFFGYRNIDVSSIKELCEVLAPDLFEEMQTMPEFDKKNAKHRALPDTKATINELRFYCQNFLCTAHDFSPSAR